MFLMTPEGTRLDRQLLSREVRSTSYTGGPSPKKTVRGASESSLPALIDNIALIADGLTGTRLKKGP
jgi:hypothetical protein